jgi:serine/threonine protein kinase
VLFRIVEDEMPPLPDDLSVELRDFLRLCFIKDPKARPEAAVMFEHPWVKRLNPEIVSHSTVLFDVEVKEVTDDE